VRDDLEIAKIEKQYDGQWVVVAVTKVDKYNNPKRGRLLFHGTDQDQVYGQGAVYRDAHPGSDLFFFYAGDPIPQGIASMFTTTTKAFAHQASRG